MCHVGHQPFARKKCPKSHKNWNPRMPIFMGWAYFHVTENPRMSGTLVLAQTVDTRAFLQFSNELGKEAGSFSNLALYPGH